MKIIYSPRHRLHAPGLEFTARANALLPHPESPRRADNLLAALKERGLGAVMEPHPYSEDVLTSVHDSGLIAFLKNIAAAWTERLGGEVPAVADVFAFRPRPARPPRDIFHQVGYYCFDPQTPVLPGTYQAALTAARCALTGSELLLSGESPVYALCRPPGHHAGRDFYGGYCYFNNAALAARRLAAGETRTAVLDLDFHHGNGTQDIFYDSAEVLYVSLHADPNSAYPYFSGYEEERGEGPGEGTTCNHCLPRRCGDARYLACLDTARREISAFRPAFLVVSLGLDPLQDDPVGDLGISPAGFAAAGRKLAELGLPLLVVQEGGYAVDRVAEAAVSFFQGLKGAAPAAAVP
jgi:acetoin utilization deacetylase AcuC-like enzyme